jgi:hypothetical protein
VIAKIFSPILVLMCFLPCVRGENFQPPANTEIVWSTSTTNLPSGLWVYKVIPQNFSQSVVSNLMVIGDFHWQNLNKKNPFPTPFPDTNLITFNKDSRALHISPAHGWINYHATTDERGQLEGVPSREDAEKLALKYLFLLGIDRSQIADKPRGQSLVTQEAYRYHGEMISAGVAQRGIYLLRVIDGVKMNGTGMQGGFYIEFGNHGHVRNFDLTWRNLLPYEAHAVASGDEIIDEIKNGKGSIPMGGIPQKADFEGLKKLTVTKITPYYAGANGRDPQEFVTPFAELELTADTAKTNFVFQLHCPILSTNAAKL